MGFGSAFKKAWNAASDFGRKAASRVAADVNAAKAFAVHGTRAVANAAHDAGVAIENTASAARNTAVRAGVAVKNAAVAAGNVAKDAAIATKNTVVSTAKRVGNVVTSARKQVHAVSAAAVNDAYKQMHAVFGRQPVGQPIQPCPHDLDEKLKRLSKRQSLIASAMERKDWRNPAERQAMVTAANRLAKNNKVVERARLAADVYGDPANPDPSPPVGWKRLREHPELVKQLGLDGKLTAQGQYLAQLLAPTESGFRAEIYISELPGDEKIVVAFKGTNPTSGEDWWNNFKQDAGFDADYYSRAKVLADVVKEKIAFKGMSKQAAELEFTGHSLGGGLAAAASLWTNSNATTFNAAGVHADTIAGRPNTIAHATRLIDSYVVEGEGLARAQQIPFVEDAAGRHFPLPAVDSKDPSGQGYSRAINRYNPVAVIDRHLTRQMIDGVEQQKADDVHLLESLS